MTSYPKYSRIKGVLIYLLRPIPDKLYLSFLFFIKLHKLPNWKKPKSYNEKMQWLKLYDRNPLYTILVDKCKVKEYVAEKIGTEYVIPAIGIWDSTDDIDFDSLPSQFVLKWNHDCGSAIICTNKKQFNIKKALKCLTYGKWINGYFPGREWPYKNVPPKVFAEQYIDSKDGQELINYRFYYFNEELKSIIIERRNSEYDYIYSYYKNYVLIMESSFSCEVLSNIDKMIPITQMLAIGLNHARIDMYCVDTKIYFGEYTFFDSSGFCNSIIQEHYEMASNWLKLPTQ